MPKPSPLPRKYASLVDEAQSNLRLIAQKVKAVVAHLETNPRVSPHVTLHCANLIWAMGTWLCPMRRDTAAMVPRFDYWRVRLDRPSA